MWRCAGASLLSTLAGCASVAQSTEQAVEPQERYSVVLLAAMQDYESDWNPHDEYESIELDWQAPIAELVDVQIALQYAEQDRAETVALENDYGFRVRLIRNPAPLVPYVGAGLAFVAVRERENGTDVDGTQGLYVRGGVEWRFSNDWFLELDLKAVRAGELDLDEDRDFHYVQIGLGIGVRL
jgi:opacity protein-like surface antigen